MHPSRTSLPEITPVRPVRARAVPRGREWHYEPKLDGFRGTLYVENGRGWFRSKTRRVMKRFQLLADAIAGALPVKNAIFDGEIVVLGDRGPDFFALMRGAGNASYVAFDLLWLNGRDLRSRRYGDRKKRLKAVVERTRAIGYVESFTDPDLFEAARHLDLEGIVAKRAGDPYDEATEWIKVKYTGYSQNEGRWELFER